MKTGNEEITICNHCGNEQEMDTCFVDSICNRCGERTSGMPRHPFCIVRAGTRRMRSALQYRTQEEADREIDTSKEKGFIYGVAEINDVLHLSVFGGLR